MNYKPRISQGLPAALILVVAALAPGPAIAQGLNIAVIDFDAAVKGWPMTEKRMAEQQDRQRGYKSLITAQEKKVQDLVMDRDAFRNGSPEWLAKNEEFESQVFMLRERRKRLLGQADLETAELFLELYSRVDEAITVFAKLRKFDLVLRNWPLDRLGGVDDRQQKLDTFRTRDLLFSAPHLDQTRDFIDFLQSWQPTAEATPGKNTVDKASLPGKVSK